MNHSTFRKKRNSSTGERSENNRNQSSASRGKGGFNGGRNGRPQRKKLVSKLDPKKLVKQGVQTDTQDFRAERTFAETPLNTKLKEILITKGYERPSEIQDKTLEYLLDSRDLLGIAQTGTGKTGAFLIPIIEQLIRKPVHNKTYALVMVPTRELATQVQDEFKSMTKGLGLHSACFIGGTSINSDMQNLRRSSHLVIATPGRLLDLVNRRALDLSEINTLILDEFDRMLDMGFINDVKKTIKMMRNRKQTLLFSATLDDKQSSLIGSILRNPVEVKISSGSTTGDHIDQDVIYIKAGENKFDTLTDLMKSEGMDKLLIFDEAKHKVKKLTAMLNKNGIQADEIHGNKTQSARQKALKRFKAGQVQVLVATDVAARGLDVSDVTHVINYQLPMTFDSYIHRIGRTGRAGKKGKAFTFVDPR